jgi:hypothetical protein
VTDVITDERGGLAVAVVAASAVVVLSGAGVDTGLGGPDPADGGEVVVFDPAMGDGRDFAGGPGDGRGSGVGL